MNDQAGQGGIAPELTKHSTTIRSRDGRRVSITRGAVAGLHALTVNVAGEGGAKLTAWLHDLDLRALFISGEECCRNCHFSRVDPSGRELRCHRNTPRKRGDEVFFPRMAATAWCGKYRSMIPAAPSAVAA